MDWSAVVHACALLAFNALASPAPPKSDEFRFLGVSCPCEQTSQNFYAKSVYQKTKISRSEESLRWLVYFTSRGSNLASRKIIYFNLAFREFPKFGAKTGYGPPTSTYDSTNNGCISQIRDVNFNSLFSNGKILLSF